MKLSRKQAWNIIERAVKRGMECKKSNPPITGINDKLYRKGHKYITLVYDMINNGVEYISYDRKKKSLDQYYSTLSKEQLSSITAISMDMWDPFMSSTMEHVPDARRKIVFDRFHVMKHVNMAVDSTRRKENRMFLEKGMDDPGEPDTYGSTHQGICLRNIRKNMRNWEIKSPDSKGIFHEVR